MRKDNAITVSFETHLKFFEKRFINYTQPIHPRNGQANESVPLSTINNTYETGTGYDFIFTMVKATSNSMQHKVHFIECNITMLFNGLKDYKLMSIKLTNFNI